MKYIFTIASLLVYFPLCFAPIIRTTNITDILTHTQGTQPKKTLVLFDIDEVLGIPGAHNSDFKLVERTTVPMINRLQNNKFYCCALTARGAWSHTVTRGQLKKHGIDFSVSTPFKKVSLNPNRIEHNDGIAYVANQSKGAFLKHLLTEHKLDIQKIIFIDDKHYNLVDVEQTLAGMNFTNFIGLHYTRAADSGLARKSSKKAQSNTKTKTS